MVDPKSGKYDNLLHIGPDNIESFSGQLYNNVNTVKDDNLISGKFYFNKGDVIYAKINPQLGKYTFAQFDGLASADAYVLNAKVGLDQSFLFALLQTQHFFKYSVSVSMRSGMPKIRFANFGSVWKNRKLRELADIVHGASPRPIQNPKWFDKNSDVGWLRISDVTEQDEKSTHSLVVKLI